MKITSYSKHYDLADLPIPIGMGNVLNVVTDRKLFEEGAFSTTTGITVTDQVGISVDAQHVITKTSADGWNAGGASVETITGDGSVKWTLTNTVGENINMAVGLSTVNAVSQNFTTIQYTWRTGVSSHAIYESGVIKNNYSGLVAGTVFEIRRTGTTLEYLKNGVVIRTVTGVTTSPLLVDISMYYINTKIRHLEINNSGTQRYFVADVKTFSDYYPYGMQLPYRHGEDVYSYGFNGKEKDDELKGEGNSYDFGARIYDPRIGRWLTRDPQESTYPHQSPYAFVNNSPLIYNDPTGKSGIITITEGKNGNPGTVKLSMDVRIYGNGATPELATSMQDDINKLLADNIKTVMVNGQEYKVEFDVNITVSTYESAFSEARGESGNKQNEDYSRNYVRVEQVNVKQGKDPFMQMHLGTRAGKTSEWYRAGDNTGFLISADMSDPTIALHEFFHGLLLLHEDMIRDGTAPSISAPTGTKASMFKNILPQNTMKDKETGEIVIKPTTRIPMPQEFLLILEKAGYKVNPDRTGIENVVFKNGTNTVNVGKN